MTAALTDEAAAPGSLRRGRHRGREVTGPLRDARAHRPMGAPQPRGKRSRGCRVSSRSRSPPSRSARCNPLLDRGSAKRPREAHLRDRPRPTRFVYSAETRPSPPRRSHGRLGLRSLTSRRTLRRGSSLAEKSQLHGFSLTHSFQTKPRQRCSQRLARVRWHGPSGILLPTPKPLFVR
jgi:hypothetical protein